MKNTIRCCISCILPCGALDVIRIVHCNGHVEEISGTIKASEILKAHPKHVLKKPSSSSDEDGVVPKIVILPPDAELQRGKIYFLMPVPPSSTPTEKSRSRSGRKKRKEQSERNNSLIQNSSNHNNNNSISMASLLVSSDRYLSEILSEKVSTQRDRRRGRVAVWRPHLESISESPNDIKYRGKEHIAILRCNGLEMVCGGGISSNSWVASSKN
ncbi:6,7-dimethyl-8-ribityllumazine synthase [Quillaja saponaria]|uniref:6,7-dimethyl-8-ribityllumazine synthase n=1 Tax=Quillaja saponaria TaxID=32244 RepID=A0AAD7M2H7_QUISA|nr:6,7-dimethyl-8-ribityllumazine synthase [Quillaja saponaria]